MIDDGRLVVSTSRFRLIDVSIISFHFAHVKEKVEKNSNFFTFLWLFGGAVKNYSYHQRADFPKDLLKR
jgi:hypothetical protein